MNNFLEIIDDFLPADVFNHLRAHCDQLDYSGVVNPVDNVLYPGISLEIPEVVMQFLGRPKYAFLRLSLEGVLVPHQAHTDLLMGQKSLMFYVTHPKYCRGGTSLVQHVETGMYRNPVNSAEEALWQRDTNIPEMWEVHEMAEMVPNRAVLFDAELMHRAEPLGGFGTDAKNGRLVLTAFY
jgi:hypothetical protein